MQLHICGHKRAFRISSLTVETPEYQNECKSQTLRINLGASPSNTFLSPQIAEFLYDYLPPVDEHNKQRQSILNLDNFCPTKCCWFRLCSTIIGMAVTDLYRLYWCHNFEKYEDMGVVSFSDKICTRMKLIGRQVLTVCHSGT